MVQDLVIGIDSSTSATKAIAWTANGEPVAEGRAPIALTNPRPGWFEQDPAEWWGSTVTALKAVTAAVDPGRIAAVAISNQRETFGYFSEDGTALRPGTVWLDERARAQEQAFGATFGAERVHRLSGKPLDVVPCLYRVLWFRDHEPDLIERAAKVAEVHGYLAFRLTGRWVTSTASADPMGLLDMARLDWADEILDAAGLARSKLPTLARPGERMGALTPAAAAATGLRAGTPVIAGGGDGQCAGTGVNVMARGRAYINLGTAVVAGSYGDTYAHDRAFRTETAIADGGYIYESCLRAGAFLIDWTVRELFQIDPRREPGIFKALEAEAAAVPIGAGGLVLVPYWVGCMTPYWDSAARGVIAGLNGSHRRGHVWRALLEGIALEQAMVTDQMVAATGTAVDHFVAIGGGAASDLWCQILADATGRTVYRSTTIEASCLGAAMAAAAGAGWFGSIAQAAEAMAGAPVRRFAPEPKAQARYRDLAALHRDLWPLVSAWNRRLAAFAESADA